MLKIELECCLRTDSRYQAIRDRHYVANRGTHGQQLHFLIWYDNEIVGIISGASSVYAVAARDSFFNIPKDKLTKQQYYLPSIVNNTVFRLEKHVPNLATAVLSKWRKAMQELWQILYKVPVIGFETFVVEEDHRKGTLYKADNWHYLGRTKGSTKQHKGLANKAIRVSTDVKLIYCIKTKKHVPDTPYLSSWRMSTPEEKLRAKQCNNYRRSLIGERF